MKQLEEHFEGRGEMRGYLFHKFMESEKAYVYLVQKTEEDSIHYEVFLKKINNRYNCISYPKSSSFGKWAWCILEKEDAIERFNELNTKEHDVR